MDNLFLQGYAVRLLLEASVVDGDPGDGERYYCLECGFSDSADQVRFQVGKRTTFPTLGLLSVDTTESISSEQSASLNFNGASEVAQQLLSVVRPMDRLRIEISRGKGWSVAFDGFVSGISSRVLSNSDSYRATVSLAAQGLWKVMVQNWFNWMAAVQPGYDLFYTKQGQSLFKTLSTNAMGGHEIVREFVDTALSLSKLKTREGIIKAGAFFEFGTGWEWQTAFSLAYPMPSETLSNMRGSLATIIQTMSQPDVHECFCTYRTINGREKPTIVFRPRPWPGPEGDDVNWKSLTAHRLVNEPAARSISSTRNDSQHPNVFHWAQGSATTTGFTAYETKILYGSWVDSRSLYRYGYASRPVAPTMTPLTKIGQEKQAQFLGYVNDLVKRLAVQEAPLPELWNRTVQLPLRPGIRAGDVVEEYSMGAAWTGYVSSVQHHVGADPWSGATTLSLIRCYPCTVEDYPNKVRSLVEIAYRPYVVDDSNGAADSATVKAAIKMPMDLTNPAATPVKGVNYGAGIIAAANTRGVPPWVLAHIMQNESSMGTLSHPDAAGIMQFREATANDLNSQGYDKPFSYAIAAKDPAVSLDAAAWYVAKNKRTLDANMPITYSEEYKWAWAMRAYNKGLTDTLKVGFANNWSFPANDQQRPEFGRYWGPDAVLGGQAKFGGLK